MARYLLAMIQPQLVTVAVTAARPSAPGDGVAITSWRTNGEFSTRLAAVFLDGSTAQTLASPTGGADGPELWGYRLSQWWRIGVLHNGADIPIVGASQGFTIRVDIVGVFERLHIAGTPSAGTCQASLAPIQEWTTP